MPKYKRPEEHHSAIEILLLNIANELADQNDIARQMLEVHKEQVALLKKRSGQQEDHPDASGTECRKKATTTSESFYTHVKNKRFRVVKDRIVANIISTDQEVRPGNVISGGSYNPSCGKVRFDVYDSSDVNAKYLGITDIPIDMVLGYIRDGTIVVH